jgi:hypothetical protein
MADRTVESSPQGYARSAGLLYLGVIVFCIFPEFFVRGQLVDYENAAATARNIGAHESLFRAGFVSDSLALVCDIALALLMYVLLRPIDRNLALLAMIFELVGDAIGGVISLGHFTALLLVGSARTAMTFRSCRLPSATSSSGT